MVKARGTEEIKELIEVASSLALMAVSLLTTKSTSIESKCTATFDPSASQPI